MRLRLVLAITIGWVGCGLADADEVRFDLDNRSAQSVVGLYATPKGTEPSQTNLLSAGALAAATIGPVTLGEVDSVCVYDLVIEFADGSRLDRPDVDLCHTDVLEID